MTIFCVVSDSSVIWRISKSSMDRKCADQLEQAGLVSRHVQQIMPPSVEYRLTPAGQIFIEPIEMLYTWAIDHTADLDALAAQQAAGVTVQTAEAGEDP
ncbi:winged helix-turn-helix transcriptional regulator [Acetobacter persici]|uniref:winged helix-turn-helix transcriptional regulator n=1 Tax=Acetobacter persici TaxID=1076596 RepID=UPI0039E7F295